MRRVEPVHRLHQSQPGHLYEVVMGLAPVAEPQRHVLGDRQVFGHQPIAYVRSPRVLLGEAAQLDEERFEVGVVARLIRLTGIRGHHPAATPPRDLTASMCSSAGSWAHVRTESTKVDSTRHPNEVTLSGSGFWLPRCHAG